MEITLNEFQAELQQELDAEERAIARKEDDEDRKTEQYLDESRGLY